MEYVNRRFKKWSLDVMRGVEPGREERRGTRRVEAEMRHEEKQKREQSRAERSEASESE